MQAIPALMSQVRYCPGCRKKQVVNYWIHDGILKELGERLVRYQCSKCSTQVEDLDKSDMSVEERDRIMAKYLHNDTLSSPKMAVKKGGFVYPRGLL